MKDSRGWFTYIDAKVVEVKQPLGVQRLIIFNPRPCKFHVESQEISSDFFIGLIMLFKFFCEL